jgi:protein gp37
MSMNSKIQWTEASWNPVSGCTRAGPECDHCYAVPATHRLAAMGQTKKYGGLTVLNPKGDRHFNGIVRTHDDALDLPLRTKKPTTWFVNSMSDLFHKEVPFEFIDKVFAVMALCPHHTFQILTKRPERMTEYMTRRSSDTHREAIYEYARHLGTIDQLVALANRIHNERKDGWPLPNVWLGTSVGVKSALHRIDELRKCRAAIRFLSLEPLLEDLGQLNLDGIHWVITGGESGKDARPCHVEWIERIVAQCKAANVPCFVKQLGKHPMFFDDGDGAGGPVYEFRVAPPDYPHKITDPKGGNWDEWPEHLRVRQMPEVAA